MQQHKSEASLSTEAPSTQGAVGFVYMTSAGLFGGTLACIHHGAGTRIQEALEIINISVILLALILVSVLVN